ncbi:hypothetical protein [uncultured Anaeromusa sp.]|uniref:hypothetical protein n=1 Tax=uncultured Anaeromusa sp. TaxID=673273 RepID=UPI0029C90496|nr:hypothetical protein [uncultured Anaeromusa sp.]
MKTKNSRELWQEYAFLTMEMRKFVSVPDWATLEALQLQREEVQNLLIQGNDDFRETEEGQTLLQQVLQEQELLVQAVDALKRNVQQQHANASAYQGVAGVIAHVERKG